MDIALTKKNYSKSSTFLPVKNYPSKIKQNVLLYFLYLITKLNFIGVVRNNIKYLRHNFPCIFLQNDLKILLPRYLLKIPE